MWFLRGHGHRPGAGSLRFAGRTRRSGGIGRVREAELRAAAAVLGIGEVSILCYADARWIT
jgi:LmbE family N-acetylglucosaminyl deacetylase